MELQKIIKSLKNNKNIILTGAPGTGKTYMAKNTIALDIIADETNYYEKIKLILGKMQENEEYENDKFEYERYKKYLKNIKFIQFHPSYDYTDFVEGLRPDCNGGFKRTNGIFKEFCKDALNSKDEKFVFIIDEINRGEVSRIFGELFYSIELGYRGENGKVDTQYKNLIEKDEEFCDGFYIPENIYIIGTMNDIDRSVESFDFAFRRRFMWHEITAEDSFKYMKLENRLVDRVKKLNDLIGEKLGIPYQIGGAYIKKYVDEDNMLENNAEKYLWEYSLEPLLREYVRGKKDEKTLMEEFKNAYGEFEYVENSELIERLGIKSDDVDNYKIVFHTYNDNKTEPKPNPADLDEKELQRWNESKELRYFGNYKYLITFVKNYNLEEYIYRGIQTKGEKLSFVDKEKEFKVKTTFEIGRRIDRVFSNCMNDIEVLQENNKIYIKNLQENNNYNYVFNGDLEEIDILDPKYNNIDWKKEFSSKTNGNGLEDRYRLKCYQIDDDKIEVKNHAEFMKGVINKLYEKNKYEFNEKVLNGNFKSVCRKNRDEIKTAAEWQESDDKTFYLNHVLGIHNKIGNARKIAKIVGAKKVIITFEKNK